MSHFSVLVIGPDVAEQLQPFHEFECTGTDDQYVQDVDVTAESLKDYEEHKEADQTLLEFIKDWNGKEPVPHSETPDRAGKHKYGFIELTPEGEVSRVIRRTNPNAKWDWWVYGGRWSDFLTPQSDDPAPFRGMIQAHEAPLAAVASQKRWDAIAGKTDDYKATLHTPMKKDFFYQDKCTNAVHEGLSRWHRSQQIVGALPRHTPWREMIENRADAEIAEIRERYHDQPRVKAWTGRQEGLCWDVDDTLLEPQEYASQFIQKICTTHAFLRDGQWVEKGDMGWFGMVAGEKDHKSWADQWGEMFAAIPDDELISVVDCHI